MDTSHLPNTAIVLSITTAVQYILGRKLLDPALYNTSQRDAETTLYF